MNYNTIKNNQNKNSNDIKIKTNTGNSVDNNNQ